MARAWFSICANNYLAYARTLWQSLTTHHPDADFTLFLADELPDKHILDDLPFPVVPAAKLDLPTFRDMTLRYDVMEFATAIKPACFQFLFQKPAIDDVVYLDPDILICAPLEKLSALFTTGYDLILTPHIQTPYEDDKFPDNEQIYNAGRYNLGFAAMRQTSAITDLLIWWKSHLQYNGFNDLNRGLFVDQKIMEQAPDRVATTAILDDPGYNAAYWNLHERSITKRGAHWYANEIPLAFFHFSGVIPGDHTTFSKHQNRFSRHDIGTLSELLDEYLDHIQNNEHDKYKNIPYQYDMHLEGTAIRPLLRRTYAASFPDRVGPIPLRNSKRQSNNRIPFDPALYTQPSRERPELSQLSLECRAMRPDLQHAFPLDSNAQRQTFHDWFLSQAKAEFDVPEIVLKALQLNNPPNMQNIKSGWMTHMAGILLNAAPTLRPLYQNIPVSWRRIVKTGLYRTQSQAGNNSAQLSFAPASGSFTQERKTGVHYVGYVHADSGIGHAARMNIQALRTQNIPVQVSAVKNVNDIRERVSFPTSSIRQSISRLAVFHLNAEQVLKLEELVNPRRFDGTYRIGYWVWELARFPEIFHPALDRMDEIWVPSTFVRDGLTCFTDKPITIVPHIVAPQDHASLEEHASPGDKMLISPAITAFRKRHDCVFLTSFDVHSFVERKNPAAVISAFKKAFPPAQANRPGLIVRAHGINSDQDECLRSLQGLIGEDDTICLSWQPLTRTDYEALQSASDVFVSLHRSEGFGLNVAETMGLGKAVIATDYAGTADYLDQSCGMPIPASLVPVPPSAYPHGGGQLWAHPSQDAAVAAMRQLAESSTLRQSLGKRAQDKIRIYASANRVGAIMRDALVRIDPSLSQ